MLCLSTQFQNPKIRISKQSHESDPGDPQIAAIIESYRTKVVQCLVLANFSRGGPQILETLANYVIMEQYLRQDSDVGNWLVVGNVIQIGK